jgi:hypothetical protein
MAGVTMPALLAVSVKQTRSQKQRGLKAETPGNVAVACGLSLSQFSFFRRMLVVAYCFIELFSLFGTYGFFVQGTWSLVQNGPVVFQGETRETRRAVFIRTRPRRI